MIKISASTAFLGLLVLAACGSSELVVSPERVRLSTQGGDSTVRSDFLVNTCGEPERLEIEESPTRVEVRTVIRVQGGDCEDIGISVYDTAELEQPLGQRQLVAVG